MAEHGETSKGLIWKISIGSASLSLVCGFAALVMQHHDLVRVVDALYSSLHLLHLHMPDKDMEEATGLPRKLLYIARFLAAVAVASTSVAVVFQILGREIRLWLTALRGNHAVVAGLGRVGAELVRQMAGEKLLVVAIDKGEDAAVVNGALEAGASVMVGDPADAAFLRRAGVAKAKYLFAASDDDTVNISAGLLGAGMARPPSVLHVYVHVEEPQLRAELHKKHLVAESREYLHARTFSVYENSARLLLRDHPLDRAPIGANDPRTVQLVLVGFGFMGESILVRAAMAAHYANLKPLKAVVIDAGAKRAERIFLARYKEFGKVAAAEFLDLDPEEPETQRQIAALCQEPAETLSTVVVCLEDATKSLTVALSLAGFLHPSVPIRYRLDEDAGIGKLIPMTAFGSIAAACAVEHWANKDLDVMARALHEDYVRKVQETERGPGNPSTEPWDSLSEQLRESNRQAADHIPVKLRAVGCHVKVDEKDPGVLVTQFSDAEVEVLARMEHRRWMAERFLAGWVLGPKDTERRVSPYLVEWEELPPYIQEYDRNAVRIIPGVLKEVGREIRR
jgi:voltage-gated potassium channel Kch